MLACIGDRLWIQNVQLRLLIVAACKHNQSGLQALSGSVKAPEKQQRSCVLRASARGGGLTRKKSASLCFG
jgi:hypothetical protein